MYFFFGKEANSITPSLTCHYKHFSFYQKKKKKKSVCVCIYSWNIFLSSCDSSVSIALGYGLDDWGSRIRFPAGAGSFSHHHHTQNSSEAHPASYPMGTRGSFPGGKADEA
jgi:hypothetical protein